MPKVFIIHTSLVSYSDLNERFKRNAPDLEVFNIVDDSLLNEVSSVGKYTPAIVARLSDYFRVAESKGADLIFNQCSSVGIAAEIAAESVNVPVLRVDDAMACQAVEMASKIAVVATVSSTVEPSTKIINDKADKLSKKVVVDSILIDGALELLMDGKREEHNEKVLTALKEIDGKYDVIVLAQGSMVNLSPLITNMNTPILTSPELGVIKAIKVLDR